jgi:hypothetical protein
MERLSGYQRNEFVEFAQLFISDGETILIEDNPRTRPTSRGRWVQGWFMVTPVMVDRYRSVVDEMEADGAVLAAAAYDKEMTQEEWDSLRGYTDEEAWEHDNPGPTDIGPPPWQGEF